MRAHMVGEGTPSETRTVRTSHRAVWPFRSGRVGFTGGVRLVPARAGSAWGR